MAEDSKKEPDALNVALLDDMALVQVKQRGSFKVSSALKEFGQAAMNRDITRFVFDMSECVSMDSTFMGVIAGLALRLRNRGEGEIIMVELSPRTRGLLSTLGLDQVVSPHTAGATPEPIRHAIDHCRRLDSLPGEAADQQETASTMLQAHESLVELSPENYPRFKDVLTFLREDLKDASGTPPPNG